MIQIEGVSKYFDTRVAVDGLDLAVPLPETLPRGFERRDGLLYRSQIQRRVVVEIPVTVGQGPAK